MTDSDAGVDMNSTPLSKLPPPPVMTDQPSLPQGATYQDVLKSVELSRSRPIPVPAAISQTPPQTTAQFQQMMPARVEQPTMEQQRPVYVEQQRKRRVPEYSQQRRARRHVIDDIPEKNERFTLKSVLPGLAVAGIVFMVLFKIAPMIATSLPFSVDSVTGKFTTTGLLLVSFLAGGSFLFVDEMVLKKYD